jgi:hypothetical protein
MIEEELQNCNLQKQGHIVIMSDFIIDRIIKLKSKKELYDILESKFF